MLFRKNGFESDSNLQNQFTAYLVRAVRRKRGDFLDAHMRRSNREVCMDLSECLCDVKSQELPMDEQLCDKCTSFGDVCFENGRLEAALRRLSDRDRDVLFAKVIAGYNFEELTLETGLSYKGVSTVYYRAIQKLKKELEANEHEIS